MTISYDKSLVQILNWTITETDAQLIILIRFLRYLVQIILFYTWTHWNLIRILPLKLRKLFLDNFAYKNDLFSRAPLLTHNLAGFPLFIWAIIGYLKCYIAFCPWPLTLPFDLWTWPSFNIKRQILMYYLWRHFSARSSFYCFIW